ncbi:hypothetical protein [Leptolyngbya sp. O-77]|uniref:hypothetical protein n=1 Tax=Leptolyngbya sp. O-77 TaxID=1080068 RepID=UPI002570AB7F|nr:hypothetical protein [Leptolyngbya sp. O-77]
MVEFHIQPDGEIPASTQLYNQIRFAIASRQFPPRTAAPQHPAPSPCKPGYTATPSAKFIGCWRTTAL